MSQEHGYEKELRERVRALPALPGVYLMKAEDGEVLYVGKAINLRSRVSSYFGSSDDGRYHLPYLLERVRHVETVVTEGERQALVLENDLIKKYKPRYNIRLKDDKAHLIVRIDMSHEWPRLELVRQVREDGAKYIGPFAFGYELRTMLEVIKRSIPLRTCSNSVIYNRVRPCLEYQIKRCAAPCCLDVDKEQYRAWLEQAVSVLKGKTDAVIEEVTHDLERASEELRFEDAAMHRDRIEILKRVRDENSEVQFGQGMMDAVGLYREGNNIELSLLRVRLGRLFDSKTFGFSETELPTEEILGSLLSQFYSSGAEIPPTILLPSEIEDASSREELYSEIRGGAVELRVPKRGVKARLLALAADNAKENFEARFSSLDKTDRILEALKVELGLEETPRVIECIDISHFQGGATVGSLVCFKDMKPHKAGYRAYSLSQEGKPDDFASMREVVGRRISRGIEENSLPDLLVIDGGPGQLSQAVAVRKELSSRVPEMIGLAKKRTAAVPYRAVISGRSSTSAQKPERIYREGSSVPILLGERSEALHLLERIRNEAHRFAITTHRKKRAKKTFRSVLDDIPGVGKTRRTMLLKEFRSVDAIRKAGVEQLAERCNLPRGLAERIHLYLNKTEQAES